jgi:aspartyl-tRNA(Asn)/glutamyl-tRNA(Gln) amidotransferase subunit C
MSISPEQLKQLASLAYLELNPEWVPKLTDDINSIVNLVAELQVIDTTHVEALTHPIDNTQRLRMDEARECNMVECLAERAPQFQDNLYLVPKVIK